MINATGETEEGEPEAQSKVESEGECPASPSRTKPSRESRQLTDEEVVGQAVTFLLGGYETTANALAYTSYLLALNPDIQEKLQSEIDTYFEEKPVLS
jgi:cytochrome P450